MLGRFLEISVHTPVIQESLEFYESLGFIQASVSETWPWPYAVVSDGRLAIGLHGGVIRSPALTFVLPDLARAAQTLLASGVSFDQERLGTEVFNQVMFEDPNGLCINLIEARTFSPLTAAAGSDCGYFSEVGIPVRDTGASRSFWEPLGFVAMDEESEPFPRSPVTSDHLNLGLYRTRALRQIVLTFEAADMGERLTRLRAKGLRLLDEMPDSLDDSTNAVLEAPEGTRLLLMHSDF